MLHGVPSGGSFSTCRTAPRRDLAIEVIGVGELGFPVTAAAAKQLRAVARPAKYGHGSPTAGLEAYDSEYTGYMGNWGNIMDRWYRRAVLVIWPRSRAFAIRAKGDPLAALGELLADPLSTNRHELLRTLLDHGAYWLSKPSVALRSSIRHRQTVWSGLG